MSKKHSAQNEGHRQIIRSTKAKRSAKKAKAHGAIDHRFDNKGAHRRPMKGRE